MNEDFTSEALAYLLDDLDPDARAEFEHRLATDHAAAVTFKSCADSLAEFALGKTSRRLAAADRKAMLDSILRSVGPRRTLAEPAPKPKSAPNWSRYVWPMAAAAAVALNIVQLTHRPNASRGAAVGSPVETADRGVMPDASAYPGASAGNRTPAVVPDGSPRGPQQRVRAELEELARLRQEYTLLQASRAALNAQYKHILGQLVAQTAAQDGSGAVTAMELVDRSTYAEGNRKGILDLGSPILPSPGIIAAGPPVAPVVAGGTAAGGQNSTSAAASTASSSAASTSAATAGTATTGSVASTSAQSGASTSSTAASTTTLGTTTTLATTATLGATANAASTGPLTFTTGEAASSSAASTLALASGATSSAGGNAETSSGAATTGENGSSGGPENGNATENNGTQQGSWSTTPNASGNSPYAVSLYNSQQNQGYLTLYDLPNVDGNSQLVLWVQPTGSNSFQSVGDIPAQYYGESGSIYYKLPNDTAPPSQILITVEPKGPAPAAPSGPVVLRGP